MSSDGLERLRRIKAVCKLWCRVARPVIKKFLSNPRHFFSDEDLRLRDSMRKKRRERLKYERAEREAENAEREAENAVMSEGMAILTETINRSVQVLGYPAPDLYVLDPRDYYDRDLLGFSASEIANSAFSNQRRALQAYIARRERSEGL